MRMSKPILRMYHASSSNTEKPAFIPDPITTLRNKQEFGFNVSTFSFMSDSWLASAKKFSVAISMNNGG